ncbi:MAG: cupin domain-containing protein [Lysobacterales bacterium]
MEINADFNQRVVVHSEQLPWVDSPMPGVQRRMLDRVGDEVARATSIVRYAPGSLFSPHVHSGGEEFVVLDGVFSDEHGDFPAGTYVRNPPQSKHTPGSHPGCIIFVKLWQFAPDDRTPVIANLAKLGSVEDASRPGVSVSTLFEDHREQVRMELWRPGATVSINADLGAEILVLGGEYAESGDTLVKHSWTRIPVGATFSASAGPQGARVWIKTGGVRFTEPPTAV